jgi:Domain of unknown function (DUF309)
VSGLAGTPEPPRYVPDRELPSTPYLPGRSRRPRLEPGGGHAWAVDLYNAGCFWEAHEAWEELWRVETGDQARARLQGLILAAAACLKLVLGNDRAFLALAGRAVIRLGAAGDSWATAFADELRAFAAGPKPCVTSRPRLWLI